MPTLVSPFMLAGAAFTPLTISGCICWLKADAGVYKDAGLTLAADTETVQQWNDQSGNNNHATQATSTKRPVYRTNQCNGLPAIRDDGSNDALVITNALSSGSYSIFMVYNTRGGSAPRRAMGGSNNWLIGPYSGVHTAFTNNFISNSKSPSNVEEHMAVCVTNNGTTDKIYVGNIDVTGSNGNGKPGTMNLFGGSGAFVEPLAGDICEVVIYNSALSSTDRAAVFDYLAGRWNTPGKSNPTEPVSGVTGCILHLDASSFAVKDAQLTSPADGDAIYQWADKGGRGWKALNAGTGGVRPLYKTNILNGLPVLRFDGSNDRLITTKYLERPYTVFMVYAEKGTAAGNERALAGTGDWFLGAGAGVYRHYAGSGYVGSSTSIVQNAFHAETAWNDGSASKFYLDRTDVTISGTPIGNPLQLVVGGSEYANCDVAEILVYNSALSSGNRTAVWDYLGSKYGLF